MRQIEELHFSNSFARHLPEAFYARVAQTPLSNPHLVHFNTHAADLIELYHSESERGELVEYLNGTRELPGSDAISMLYAGHQFGRWVPQLGDGRALMLGEVTNGKGERWELQLKGSGQTPFSRDGDGRAVLRSSIREYLCSEAMHALGIPTTRALCLIGSDEEVYREQIETGALLLRMAPSHVRFGSFEVFYARNQHQRLAELADWVIEHHYPELADEEQKYLALYREVIARTARLIAQWQQVGFSHGVMNTDNFSILGLTIDYGPFGFMERFSRGYVCNHSDHFGRYAFDQQPEIGLWNIGQLGQAMLPLFDEEPEAAVEIAVDAYKEYAPQFRAHYDSEMRKKLGLTTHQDNDNKLVASLLDLLEQQGLDYTNFFRALASFNSEEGADNNTLRDMCLDREAFDRWAEDYAARLRSERSDDRRRAEAMRGVNPKYILRNYLAQQAIEATQQGDHGEIDRLINILRHPFDEQPEYAMYAAEPPAWGRALTISCSS